MTSLAARYIIAGTAALLVVPQVARAQVDFSRLSVPLFGGNLGLTGVLTSMLSIFLLVAGIVAFLIFLYAGFQYLTAGGDSGATGKAKTAMVNAIIGIIIIALSYVVVRFVVDQLDEAGGTRLDSGIDLGPSNNNTRGSLRDRSTR